MKNITRAPNNIFIHVKRSISDFTIKKWKQNIEFFDDPSIYWINMLTCPVSQALQLVISAPDIQKIN